MIEKKNPGMDSMTVKGVVAGVMAVVGNIVVKQFGIEIPADIQALVVTGILGMIAYGLKRAAVNPGK